MTLAVFAGLTMPAPATCAANAPSAAAAKTSLAVEINRCRSRLPQVGDAPERPCPGLDRLLLDSPWAGTLADTQNWTADSLDELARLSQPFLQPRAGAPRLDGRQLDPILQKLPLQQRRKPESLWSRFVNWLEQRIGDWSFELPSQLQWVGGLLNFLAEALGWLLLAILAVLIVLAVALTARGLLANLAWRRRNERRRPWRSLRRKAVARLSAADLDNAALAQKPRLLLRLILQTLEELGLIGPYGNLTNRELLAVVPSVDPAGRAILARVAQCADRVTYSSWLPPAADVEQLIIEGRSLIASLRPAPEARL